MQTKRKNRKTEEGMVNKWETAETQREHKETEIEKHREQNNKREQNIKTKTQ